VIPPDVEQAMLRQRGEVERSDQAAAVAELQALGIRDGSQFAEFFRRFKVSAVSSGSSHEELMDLASPTPQIRNATEFAREVHGVSDRFVALTSGEGEGFYLYDTDTEAVYDISVKDVKDLVAGRVPPRWSDFFGFLRWFLA
jgi:hypothetical protein